MDSFPPSDSAEPASHPVNGQPYGPELIPAPLPPAPPEVFPTLRSEDSRVVLTSDALELNGQVYGWRELEGVDVRPVRWLLGVLLGVFLLGAFLLAYLQFWLRTVPAAVGIAGSLGLLAWGARGTNRWRLYRPGREPLHVALAGPITSWTRLAQEANYRIRRRHDEAAAEAAYALALADWRAQQAASSW
ncbi:hypothetical protein [Hymenobacter pini]|uniref:hypothetical protein n=1 Tax=Hymenobacter pini TaxID=2880879 RepID=UPI001CF51AA8|nr:hypothetical protein [Hymenobacter pini]MCA8830078.1 hypothetical protein [Hymenobacter pini]